MATYKRYSYKGKLPEEIREILTKKVQLEILHPRLNFSDDPPLTCFCASSLRYFIDISMSYLISLHHPQTTRHSLFSLLKAE